MGTKNRTREDVDCDGLVRAEFWVGWCWLGRVVSRTEELRKYVRVRKIVPVKMLVVMGWLGRSVG